MKFTPDHRPLTMTGVAMLAGFVVFILLFFLVSARIPASSDSASVVPLVRTDSVATQHTNTAVRDSSFQDAAGLLRLPGLTESARASLLAATSALDHQRGVQQGRGPVRTPAGGPGVVDPRGKPQRGPHAVQAGNTVRPNPPGKPTGTVALGSLQWIGGGKRKKVYGAVPAWPAGLAAATHIKVEAVVAPDGHVRSVRPGQKGNARCEEAATRAVERWRFERLARHIPQRDQRCVVTFTFNVN